MARRPAFKMPTVMTEDPTQGMYGQPFFPYSAYSVSEFSYTFMFRQTQSSNNKAMSFSKTRIDRISM